MRSLGVPVALLAVPLLALMLAGCAGDENEGEEIEYVERPVGLIYNIAYDELDDGNYRLAAAWFNEVERQHPYSQWATKAKLMAAYAHYQGLRYDDAIDALDRFIELHPGNPDIAYAYYLRAICQYEQIRDVRRDQTTTQNALNDLTNVVRRFPGTAFARDAQLKLDLARDHLAGKEMEIGRYYLNRGEYAASINRFQRVVKEYDTTSHVAEALHRLVEAYLGLGMQDEAMKAAATLGYNYPGSRWYEDSYRLMQGETNPLAESASWFGRAWDSLF